MTKSFTEYRQEIEDLSDGNEFIKSMLLDTFYKDIPDDINKNAKSVLNEIYFSLKRKELWTCNHNSCEVSSCYSHEISENVFLKYLADEKFNVVTLDRDVSGNVVFYREKKVHKRNANNFSGYCSEHDSSLFSDIENETPLLNSHFVNKQCLRSLHRRRFDLELQVRQADKMLSKIDEELKSSVLIQEVVANFENKRSILLKKVSIIVDVYDKVLSGINSGQYFIKFKELCTPKHGYCFSQVFDSTFDEDIEECILFFYKMDFATESKAFICWLDNKTSEEVATTMVPQYKMHFVDLMYKKKEKLVLSSVFLNQMDKSMKEVFYQDSELYNINIMEKMLLAEEFF